MADRKFNLLGQAQGKKPEAVPTPASQGTTAVRVGRRRGERESLAVVWGLPAGARPKSRDTPPFPPTGDGPAVSCCPSSGGRCGDGVEALHLGCSQRHQRVPQGLCLAGHGFDFAFAVLALVVIEALLDIGTTVF